MSPAVDLRDAVIAKLETENEELRDRIDQLEGELKWTGFRFPLEWCLTPKEAKLLSALASRMVCSKEFLHLTLYGLDPSGGAEIKIVDVFICKIRKKISPAGINIVTQWGSGYALDAPSLKIVTSYIGKAA